jgi:DNA-directed RNA polymerase subunit H (RpoH/RPB5)
MNTQHNRIVQIYKSRLNLLTILESIYGYDIRDYSGFNFNEIDAMYNNNQLDMLLTEKISDNDKKTTNASSGGSSTSGIHKTYIKYFIKSTLNELLLRNIVEDLYILSNTLTKDDCLFIIYDGEPNDSLINHLNNLFTYEDKFIIIYNMKRLQFNILEHSLVPRVSILNDTEVEEFKKKYNIDDLKKMPEISRYDPQAQAICLRPGKICKFLRNSPTSLETPYYRVCV